MTTQAAVLELSTIIKTGIDWFDAISAARAGAVISVFGPVGSGKTTLIRRIAEAMPRESVLDIGMGSSADAIARMVGDAKTPACRMITVEHALKQTNVAIKNRIWSLRTLVEDRRAFAMVEMHEPLPFAIHNADTVIETRERQSLRGTGTVERIAEFRVTKNRHGFLSEKWIEVPALTRAAP